MPLSAYDIKRIAAEVTAIQSKELSTKVTKALNQAVGDLSDEFLTTAQARRFLNVSERHLQRLKAEGVIPYSKPRGRVYFRKSALITYMDNLKK
ncbi:MAG: helix-turn-helix domain-containing protein [Tannerellaceae bacterium]|jgi:excisionase family DNA binding protein|nr:helix-turn-helix domain-containing protein [Tannerellaceae bacterium]